MEFCVITPTAGLEQYATLSKTHMVLAQEFVRNPTYAEFYLNRRAAGDLVILDNGVYEGEYDSTDFLQAIKELQPSVAVLPDVICKGQQSTTRSVQFFIAQERYFPGVEWMYIPQGKDIEEWWKSLRAARALFDEDIPAWVGLTRFLPSTTCRGDKLIRVKLAKLVREMFSKPPIHCMGMANGSLKELFMLAQQGIVRSIDSSAPVWRGWKGYKLDHLYDHERWNREGTDVDFCASIGLANKSLIDENLEAVYGSLGI